MRRRRALHAAPPSKTDALIARLHAYAESSAVALLLTADRGAVRAVAKGARRISNSYRGPLDKGVLYAVRLGRRGGDGLYHLNASSVKESFPNLRSSPARFLPAALVLEVGADLLREEEPNAALFRLCVFTLKVLDRAPKERLALAAALFLARAVALSGHVPEIDICVACGERVREEDRPLIGPVRGGVLHPHCAQGEPGARSVPGGVLELLRLFWSRPAAEVLKSSEIPAVPLRELRILLVQWLEHVLERGFRAAAPLEREFAASDAAAS
ncbi:MAG: DNA repair protein RecO [Planctomycetota bacterium]|jgi:DNA repair protein RecO (recombination protein O)